MSFDFSEDDESKTAPEEKQDKQPLGINNKDMNQMMIIGVLVVAFVLFKDEIMNAVNSLTSGGPAPAATPAPAEGGGGGEEETAGGKKGGGRGGKRGGKRGGRRGGRRRKRGGRGSRGGGAEAEANYYGMSYFGIANA